MALDYLESELPKQECLEGLQPFYREYFNYNHQIVKSNIANTPVPKDYIFIGECELKSDPTCNSYSGTWPNGIDYIQSELWKSYSLEERNMYKKYKNSGDFVTVHGKQFKKNMEFLSDALYELMTEHDSLKEFPCITFAKVNGFTPKLNKILHEKSMLKTLMLSQPGVEVLDFSDTHLRRVTLDVTGIKKVILPSELAYLGIEGKIDRELILDDKLCKYKFDVSVVMDSTEIFNYGLNVEKVKSLSIGSLSELNIIQLTESYPTLKELHLGGKPGIISNIAELKRLNNLDVLSAANIFGFTALELEKWESLDRLCKLEMWSIPKDAGMYLKKYWKGKLDLLEITQLRDENWLKENLNNPLRHWDGSEFVPAPAYKAAMKCYKNTKSKLQNATNRADIEEIAKEYVECFNKLNDKYEQFIETDEREDIFHVMKLLYEEFVAPGVCGSLITLEEVWDVIDSVRDDW